jgi:4a-hydroxytetrahydrobiopterin dehydratase
MDMISGDEITAAGLTDWRKLGQGLHARFLVSDFEAGARFLSAIGEAGRAAGHHPEVRMGAGFVDLKLISDDAVYRESEGVERN